MNSIVFVIFNMGGIIHLSFSAHSRYNTKKLIVIQLLVGYLLQYCCIPSLKYHVNINHHFCDNDYVLGDSISTLHLCFACFCIPSPKMNTIILRCLELLGYVGAQVCGGPN
jgi:hypothetical protein